MIPNQEFYDELNPDFEEVIGPTKNYSVNFDKEKIAGYVDGIESMKQAIMLLVGYERYQLPIYSFNAGIETNDLFGKPMFYVASEVKRRIADCLLQDDRITAVDNFSHSINKGKLLVVYTAHTIYGEVELEREVTFNG